MGKKQYKIGIDLGGTKILTGLIDKDWKVKALVKKKTKASLGTDAVIDRMISTVDKLLKQNDLSPGNVEYIGMGAPGMVNIETGTVLAAPNLGWRNVDLGKAFADKYKVPIAVDNDVNIGVLGEMNFGTAKGYKNVVGIFLGTGIGGAIAIDGKIIRGTHYMGGELGHMIINCSEKHVQCACGNFGCFETYGAKSGIARMISARLQEGQHSMISDLWNGDPRQLRGGILKQAVESNDVLVVDVIRKLSRDVGVGIANFMNMLDPEIIVLGGGVVEALGDFMLPYITKSIKRHTLDYEDRQTKIAISELGDDAAVIGAASYADLKIKGKI